MRFPPAGWAWPPGPRVAAAHNSGVDGRRDGREKGPMQATSGPQRDKTRPAARLGGPPGTKLSQQAALAGPPGTKLSQQAPKRRFWPTFRMQGELCTASATNNPSRENFIPHAVPLPAQNSPSKRPWQAHPVQNSPSKRLGGPPGTKLSQQAPKRRFRPTFRMQGELCTASATNNPSRENFVPLPPPTTRAGRKSHAPTPHRTPTTCPSPNFACNSIE